MNRTNLEANITELKKRIETCENYKKEILNYVQKIKNKYVNGEITYSEYSILLNKKLEGKKIKQWFEYYNSDIENCRKKIEQLKRKPRTRKIVLVFFSLFFISIIIFLAFYLKPVIIGLVTEEIDEEFISNVNVTEFVDLEIKQPTPGNKIMEFDIAEGQITLDFNLLNYTEFADKNSEKEIDVEDLDIDIKKSAEKYKWGYKIKLNDLEFMAKINIESNENIEIIGSQTLKIGNNYLRFADLVEQGYIVNINSPIILEKIEEEIEEKEEVGEEECVYSKTCGEWGDCINNYQTRICIIANEDCSESEDTETKDCIAESPFKEIEEAEEAEEEKEIEEEEIIEEEAEAEEIEEEEVEEVEEEVKEVCEDECTEVCEEVCEDKCYEEESCYEECSGEGEEQICEDICETEEVCEEVCREECHEECEEVCKIPEELFDMTFELEEDSLKESNDLVVWITLQNFGKRYVPARLIYIITDEKGEEVYKKFEEIRVYTDEFIIKKFDDLVLEEGNYNLLFEVEYAGIVEEFEDKFIVERNLFYKTIKFIKGFFKRITGSVVQEKKIVSVYVQRDFADSDYKVGDIINLDPTLTVIIPEEANISFPTLIKEIPDIEIQQNSFTEIKINEYFSNAEQYYLLQVQNISTTTYDHTIKIHPDNNFIGTRTSKIIAVNSFGITESNSFNIIVAEGVALAPEINITIPANVSTKHYKAIINRPTKWVKTIKTESIEEIKDLIIELPKEAKDISVKTGEEVQEALDKIEEYEEMIENADREDLIFGTITGDVDSDIKNQQGFITRILNRLRDFKIAGGVIKESELKEEIIETADKKIVDVGKIAEQTQETEIAVEYYTEGPTAIEEKTDIGKRVIVSGPEELNYTDILAFAEIPEKFSVGEENRIKIFWKEENKYIDFDAYDLDSNTKLDYVEWIVPHLSNQTFEIIFITKAEHLNSNRDFISDIYEQVKELDGNWSEEIPNQHYVRVTFEQNLTSDRDISLYPRIVNGNPKIEVYEVDGTELIAEFTNIISNQYNKIFLTNLISESQDVFDLKVLGGSIEIDHIIDPITTGDTAEGGTTDLWDVEMSWYHDITCGDNMVLIVGIAIDSEPTVHVNTIEYNKVPLSRINWSSSVDGEEQAEMWNLTAPDCGSPYSVNVTFTEDSAEEAAGISAVYYGVDYINLSSLNASMSDGSTTSSLSVPSSSVDNWVVNVFALDVDAGVDILISGDNAVQRGYSDWGVDTIAIADGNDTDGEVTMGWSEFNDEWVQIGVELIPVEVVADNEYPIFSNYWDDNASLEGSGTGLFNVTVTSTNGTVWLEINGNNYTATNLTETVYNASYDFSTNGTYSYRWHSWGNGTQENYNKSSERSYTVNFSYGTLDVNITLPIDNSEFNQYDVNLTINATVTCVGGDCGTVYALARYNLTANPDTAVNITTGANPFFIFAGGSSTSTYNFEGITYPTSSHNVTSCAACLTSLPPASRDIAGETEFQDADLNYTKIATLSDGLSSLANADVDYYSFSKFSFVLNENENDISQLNITYNVSADDGEGTTHGFIFYVWNSTGWEELETQTTADWYYSSFLFSDSTNISNFVDGDNKIYLLMEAGIIQSASNEIRIRADYIEVKTTTSVANPQSTTLSQGQSWNVTWALNVTTSSTKSYLIDVLFNSSYGDALVPDNHTEDRTVKLNPSGAANQAPNNPSPEINSTDGSNLTTQNLNCFDIITDPDTGDKLNVSARWYNNSILYLTIDYNNSYLNGTSFSATLDSANTTAGENWSCSLRLYDGTSYSDWKNSSMNITILNSVPQITHVFNDSMTDLSSGPTEGPSATSVIINFTAYDPDGVSDLNDNSAKINFTKTDEDTRQNLSCSKIGSPTGNYANYTCNITMWWWDGTGTWDITAYVEDNQADSIMNASTDFYVGERTAFVMGPSALSWSGISPGATNQTSNNDPITLNNTGNDDIGVGEIGINATNLLGETNPSFGLWAGNFSVAPFTGSSNEECNSSAKTMNASVYTNITGALVPAGNFTKNDGTAQEELYFCLRIIGSELTDQAYSTSNQGAWIIRILLVAVTYRRRKKKKKNISEDKLIQTMGLILDELKERYDLNKAETMNLLIREMRKKYKINKKEILELSEVKKISIPISIFSEKMGSLESLIKYMRENLEMNYNEIAKELNRDQRTIWTSYKKATEKQKEPIKIKEGGIFIPTSTFDSKGLTILESVVVYLKQKGMKYNEIAELLNRDQRNIWTTYSRAIKKIKENFE